MTAPSGPRLSNYEIRAEGWKALTARLGVSGAMRFLMEYDPGRGDYTRERRELLADITLEAALAEMGKTGAAKSPRPTAPEPKRRGPRRGRRPPAGRA